MSRYLPDVLRGIADRCCVADTIGCCGRSGNLEFASKAVGDGLADTIGRQRGSNAFILAQCAESKKLTNTVVGNSGCNNLKLDQQIAGGGERGTLAIGRRGGRNRLVVSHTITDKK